MSQIPTADYEKHSASAHAQAAHDPHPKHKTPPTLEERLKALEDRASVEDSGLAPGEPEAAGEN